MVMGKGVGGKEKEKQDIPELQVYALMEAVRVRSGTSAIQLQGDGQTSTQRRKTARTYVAPTHRDDSPGNFLELPFIRGDVEAGPGFGVRQDRRTGSGGAATLEYPGFRHPDQASGLRAECGELCPRVGPGRGGRAGRPPAGGQNHFLGRLSNFPVKKRKS